jgi:hypothetical protein
MNAEAELDAFLDQALQEFEGEITTATLVSSKADSYENSNESVPRKTVAERRTERARIWSSEERVAKRKERSARRRYQVLNPTRPHRILEMTPKSVIT